MNERKLIAISALMIMLVSTVAGVAAVTDDSHALESEDSQWEYAELANGTLKTTKYLGSDEHVVVPSKIGDKYVTMIDAHTFTTVWAGSALSSTGMRFIKSIELPSTITSIKMYGIFDTGITELHIPFGVSYIEPAAIILNKSLQKITVSDLNTSFYSKDGLLYTNADKLMQLPNALTGLVEIVPGATTELYSMSYTRADILLTDVTNIDPWLNTTVVRDGYEGGTYLSPGITEVVSELSSKPNRDLYTYYGDTITGIPEILAAKEYAILSYNDTERYIETGTAAVKPTNPVGRETKYYTNDAKTTEFVWSTLITEDVELYTEMVDVPIDGQWVVRFVDKDGDLMEAFFVDEDTPADSAMAPTAEGVTYVWYADAGLTTLYDWDEPVTGHITIYGVASPIVSDPILSVMEIIMLIGAAVIGILAVYTRNPYVALPAVILLVIAGLGYAGYIPLPEIALPSVDLAISWPQINWPTVNWPQINLPEVKLPEVNWPTVNWPQINWPKLW